MSEDKFVKSYDGVDVMFEPDEHKYFLQFPEGESVEVPPVSAVMDMLPKWLGKWSEDNGIRGCMELVSRGVRNGPGASQGVSDVVPVDLSRFSLDDHKFNSNLIHEMGMSSTAIKDAAAARGTTVHGAYRNWVVNGVTPDYTHYTGEVRGYIKSLAMLCRALEGKTSTLMCEEPICSVQYGFAGTPDHYFILSENAKLQKGGNASKRPNYMDVVGGGDVRVLLDLKTSKQVFLSHTAQINGYELMLRELKIQGPAPLDKWIVLIKADGEGYNIRRQPDDPATFLAAVALYNAQKRPEGFSGRSTFVGLETAA